MPVLPQWLVVAVSVLVMLFGLYRLRLAFRSADEDEAARERGGVYGYGRRQQALFGGVYILLVVMLILGAFGLRMPWQHCLGSGAPAWTEKNRGGPMSGTRLDLIRFSALS